MPNEGSAPDSELSDHSVTPPESEQSVEEEVKPDIVRSEPRGILKRAESTDETWYTRRSYMRPSESLDGARQEGNLRRKRSCLTKTVSWSTTVSDTTSPTEPQAPRSEGEYVEKNINPVEEPTRQVQQPATSYYDVPVQREDLKVETPTTPDSKFPNWGSGRRGTTESRKRAETPMKKLTVEDLPVDEDGDEFGIIGVYKCGLCTVGFAPVKKKKMMFVTLSERALELHESEKTYRSGKAAKHMVDLSISFNVHSEHYDAKLKKCLCLMGPDETICMRPEGGISTIEGWRRAIVKAIHDSRRRKMDRTPRPEDIFDAAYDIRVVLHMKSMEKYVESRKEHGFTNICTAFRELMGKKRLCLYPHTLAIADLRIEPTAYGLPPAGFPPFRSSNFFIIDRSTVAFYGFRENYFYIRIGKGSPYRGFEILFMVENNEVCKEIYSRLKDLINRDLENRRLESMRKPDPTLVVNDLHGMESLSVPSPLLHRNKLSLDSPVLTARDRRLLLGRDCLSFASIEKDDSAPSSPFANYNRPRGSLGNFQVDHLSRFDQPRGSIHSLGNIPIDRPRVPTASTASKLRLEPGLKEALYDSYSHLRKKHSTQSDRGDVNLPSQERKMSDNRQRRVPTERGRETEPERKPETPEPPKLPPLKLNANKPSGEFLLSLQRDKELALETLRNGFDPKTQNPDGTPREIKKDFLDTICPQPEEPDELHYSRIVNSDTYTLMGPADWSKHEDILKDDQSDSGDSCYSSKRSSMCKHTKPHLAHLGCQLPSRAQSFGGNFLRSQHNRIPPTVNLPDVERKTSAAVGDHSNTLQPPDDDPRKRAFSLGSRHFFSSSMIGFNDFRRLVGKRHNRTSSPKNASTSGISVNSSNASPSSGSINCLASADNLNAGRPGSPGSGRNSPSQKFMGSNPGLCQPKKRSEDDLVSIDFSNLGRKDSRQEAMRRFPFGGAPPGRPVVDFNTEIKEREDEERRNRERRAIEFKRREEQEAKEHAELKRESERRAQEKKDKKREEKEMKEFRPKADSGIADCTPSSSFSGKQGETKTDSGDYVYANPEGMKFLADIRKKKSITEERKNSTGEKGVLEKQNPRVVEQKITIKMVEKQMSAVDPIRRSSLCAEMNRKSSICTAIVEEKEEQSETDSRGEPAERRVSGEKGDVAPAPPLVRNPSRVTLSSLSPFKRLKFLSFRK